MKKEGTKLCKHCKTEIPADAKVCPNCRKKQGGKIKWIIIAIVVLAVIGAAVGGGNDDDEGTVATNTAGSTEASTEASTETPEPQEEISYTKVSVSQMMNDLETNAMNASDTYKDQYLEITGRLSNIDSSGKYISLLPEDEEYAIIGVQCYIQNDEQKTTVSSLSTGQTVTVRGKCTDVGEVLGYSFDIDSIN